MNLTTTKAIFLCTLLCGGAFARQPTETKQFEPQPEEITVIKPVTKPVTIADALASVSKAEPVRRAGLRASLIRQSQRILPVVVVVSDAESYLDAIGSWEGPVRFPILWDDGTARAREDIARFVRGFKPTKVLVYQIEGAEPFPSTILGRQEQIDRALTRAMHEQSKSWKDTYAGLRKNGILSPGVVVTDASDAAWAGALALAAGRIQPLFYSDQPFEHARKDLTPAQGDMLEVMIERAVESMKFDWNEIGDEIDAITIGINIGTRIDTGAKARDSVATTDRIGRMGMDGSGERWAYSGQLLGNTSACVYQAMCSLFLEIETAFLWDGYNDTKPWSDYDMTQASLQLQQFNVETELHDQPRYSLTHWRARMVRPVDASLVLVNSKGSRVRFDLPGGGAYPGDLPILTQPAAIHMVHSFSMQTPTDARTIGGRLLARGVYAYAGSVDEPYLNAFVPTPLIARRLGGSISFAAAVRYDDGDVWKIAVIGDPLVTVGTAGARLDASMMTDQFLELKARASKRVKEQDFDGAIADLVMLGRDHDAARLAMALMKDRPQAITSVGVRAALPALFRDEQHHAVINAFERLSVEDREDLLMRDLLWFSGRWVLMRGLDLRVEALLHAYYRPWQELSDAEELAMFIRRRSLPDAIAVLESLRITLKSDGQRTMLDRAIKRVRKN